MKTPNIKLNVPATVSFPNHPDPVVKYESLYQDGRKGNLLPVEGTGFNTFRIIVLSYDPTSTFLNILIKNLDTGELSQVDTDWFNEELTHRRVEYDSYV